jgi:hypothetical protein
LLCSSQFLFDLLTGHEPGRAGVNVPPRRFMEEAIFPIYNIVVTEKEVTAINLSDLFPKKRFPS